ncbi:MAG: hypothetical protein ABSG22_02980 [Sedimentisphaerales bacterium]|jgi:hypothetical protein
MSQIDEGVLPGAEEGQGEVDDVKLVPVGESIRYRKRAQGAEKRVEELAGELAEARAEATRLADELKATQKEQELMRRLASEGTRDLEAAMLIAKSRLAGKDQSDLSSVVEQLKKEKQYLFPRPGSGQVSETVTGGASPALRTSSVKEQRSGAGVLERAAKRAAGTGSRTDLQEYMRRRRSVV